MAMVQSNLLESKSLAECTDDQLAAVLGSSAKEKAVREAQRTLVLEPDDEGEEVPLALPPADGF